MSITNFTATYDLLASSNDSSDGGVDADIIPLTGTVTFVPSLTDAKPIQAQNYSPRPAGLKLRTFSGVLDSDGQLKAVAGGAVGVRLWANDPVLGIEHLYYTVKFYVTTPAGQRVQVEGGTFEAPTTDTSVSLVNVLSTTASTIVGVVRQQGYAEDIMDSGALGRALVRSETESAAWSALGTVPTSSMPGTVDNVVEFANRAAFPATGEIGRIYVALDTNVTYRWGETTYVRLSGNTVSTDITDATSVGRQVLTAVSTAAARTAIGAGTSSLAIGTTSGTAKAGDYQPAAANISDSTSLGRSVLTAADAAAARTSLESFRSRPGWFDIRDYGAVGDGVTNNRTFINNAVIAANSSAGGGTIFFPQGVFAIADTGVGISYINLNDTRANNIIFQGSGAGYPFSTSGTSGTTIKGNTGSGPIIRWNDAANFHMRDMRLVGNKASGAGNGFQMDKTANPTVSFITLSNVNVMNCGGSGIYANSPIVFNFENVLSRDNNGHGFSIRGGNLGTYSGCWAAANGQNGWYLDQVGYSNFSSCGADGNAQNGFVVLNCNATTFLATGSETNTVDAFVIDGSWSVTVDGIGIYDNNRYGIWVKGGARSVRLGGIRETAKAGGGATYSIYTQSSSQPVFVNGFVTQTPTNIAATDTVVYNGDFRTRSVTATGINAQTGTSYTLSALDAGILVTLNNSSAVTVAVPANASVPFVIGSRIRLSQLGTGQVTVAATAGVTVNSSPGSKIAARYGAAELVKIGTDTWLLTGDLSA